MPLGVGCFAGCGCVFRFSGWEWSAGTSAASRALTRRYAIILRMTLDTSAAPTGGKCARERKRNGGWRVGPRVSRAVTAAGPLGGPVGHRCRNRRRVVRDGPEDERHVDVPEGFREERRDGQRRHRRGHVSRVGARSDRDLAVAVTGRVDVHQVAAVGRGSPRAGAGGRMLIRVSLLFASGSGSQAPVRCSQHRPGPLSRLRRCVHDAVDTCRLSTVVQYALAVGTAQPFMGAAEIAATSRRQPRRGSTRSSRRTTRRSPRRYGDDRRRPGLARRRRRGAGSPSTARTRHRRSTNRRTRHRAFLGVTPLPRRPGRGAGRRRRRSAADGMRRDRPIRTDSTSDPRS